MEVKSTIAVLFVILIFGMANKCGAEMETTLVIDTFNVGNNVLEMNLGEQTYVDDYVYYNGGFYCNDQNEECSAQSETSVLGGYRAIITKSNIRSYPETISDFQPEIDGEIQINTSQGEFQSSFTLTNNGNYEFSADISSIVQFISPRGVCEGSGSYNSQTLNLKKNGGEFLVIEASSPESPNQWILNVQDDQFYARVKIDKYYEQSLGAFVIPLDEVSYVDDDDNKTPTDFGMVEVLEIEIFYFAQQIQVGKSVSQSVVISDVRVMSGSAASSSSGSSSSGSSSSGGSSSSKSSRSSSSDASCLSSSLLILKLLVLSIVIITFN